MISVSEHLAHNSVLISATENPGEPGCSTGWLQKLRKDSYTFLKIDSDKASADGQAGEIDRRADPGWHWWKNKPVMLAVPVRSPCRTQEPPEPGPGCPAKQTCQEGRAPALPVLKELVSCWAIVMLQKGMNCQECFSDRLHKHFASVVQGHPGEAAQVSCRTWFFLGKHAAHPAETPQKQCLRCALFPKCHCINPASPRDYRALRSLKSG